MNIGILTSTNPQLRQQLAAQETTDAKAQAAESDAVAEVAVAKPRPTGNTAPSVGFPSLRAALDARIAADVSSGTLAERDAAAVKHGLDQLDAPSRGMASRLPQAAQAYLATIDRGTLIDRYA